MTIIAATDRSQNSRAAVKIAARLAKLLDERLVVFVALELWEREAPELVATFEDVEFAPSAHAHKLVNDFVADVLDDHVDVRITVSHPAARAILDAADELDASLIVLGTSGHSKLGEAFFGSTVSAVVRRSLRPVLAVPPHFDRDIEAVLAPVDFSGCSVASLLYAGRLAERLGASLLVQHAVLFGAPAVAPPFVYIPELPEENLAASQQRLNDLLARLDLTTRVREAWVDLGPPHAQIKAAVFDKNIDLIVMGTHGRTGFERFFLGSTSERVLRDRSTPVLLVRGSDD